MWQWWAGRGTGRRTVSPSPHAEPLRAACSTGVTRPALAPTPPPQMGSIADASTGSFAYRASKTAVNMLGKVLANELGPQGITVTLLHPGYVVTGVVKDAGAEGGR